MSSTKTHLGYENQKMFFYYFLMHEPKKVNSSYEGMEPNEGDFVIEDSAFEAKTGVLDNIEDISLNGDSLPTKLKQAIKQLIPLTKTNKIIVTNHKILFKNIPLTPFKLFKISDIFSKSNFTHDKKVYCKKDFENIKIFSISVKDGSNISELEEYIYKELGLYNYKIDFEDFMILSDIWRGVIGRGESDFDNNIARIITYEIAENIFLSGKFWRDNIDDYIELFKRVQTLVSLGFDKESVLSKVKDINISSKNKEAIIDARQSNKNLELLEGEIYDKETWNN